MVVLERLLCKREQRYQRVRHAALELSLAIVAAAFVGQVVHEEDVFRWFFEVIIRVPQDVGAQAEFPCDEALLNLLRCPDGMDVKSCSHISS